jgi:N-acetylglucosamine-6-phosphate deacetylase
MPPGQYTEFGMGVELRPDGRLCLAGTPYLAGSAQSLLHAVETATRIGGVTLDQAIEMASTNPARLFGVDHECGRIAVGMRADLIEFDWDTSAESQLMLRRTVCAGAMTYQQD